MTHQAQDYLALIPPPNNNQPNYMAWVAATVQPQVDGMNACDALISAFDIQTAVGDQLDVIGQILGLSRTVNFQPSGGASPVLSDTNYRYVLLAKIIQNQWDGTKQHIYDYWQTYFPQFPILIQDNEDMTMNVQVTGFTGILADLVNNFYFMPRPAGVGFNYIFGNVPLFAYDMETATLKGYDEGYWASIGTDTLNYTIPQNSQYWFLMLCV